MNASELQEVALASINEERVQRIVDATFKSAIRSAKKGEFSCHIWLAANHTDPMERTNAAERIEIIRRIQDEGFKVRETSDRGHVMSWGGPK